MNKNIEYQKNISKKKQIDQRFLQNKINIINRFKNRNFYFYRDVRQKKKTLEERLKLKEGLRNKLMKVRERRKKRRKKLYITKVSEKKLLLNQIKNEEKENLLNGKNLLNQIKNKAKKNSLAEKNIIDQIKSKEKTYYLTEKKIIDQISSEKKSNRLAEKKIIDQIKKIFDQKNNEEKEKVSNEKDLSNKKKKKKGLKVSDEKKKRGQKSIEERKKIYNEKVFLAKQVIEEKKKIYDEKKKRRQTSVEERKKVYNEKKRRAKKIIEEKKKIYNEKRFIAKQIILEKETLFSKKKIKAFKDINKTKMFCKMRQARLHMGGHKSCWNPKMAPYIFTTKRKHRSYQTINLIETYKYFKKVSRFLYKAASEKKTVLFVGTKAYQSNVILKAASKSNSFFINQRWLGGILTNWKTIKKSKKRFKAIKLKEKLKIIPLHLKLKELYRNILEEKKLNNPNFLINKDKIVLLFKYLKEKKKKKIKLIPPSRVSNTKNKESLKDFFKGSFKDLKKEQKSSFDLLGDKKKSTLLKYKKDLEVTTLQFKSQGLQLRKTDYFQNLPKKQAATKQREKERFKKYLNGLTHLIKIPEIVIIVGQPVESNAVRECQRLGLKTITILDTDCDPNLTDLFVPANDESTCSLKFLLNFLSKAIQKGKKDIKKKPIKKEKTPKAIQKGKKDIKKKPIKKEKTPKAIQKETKDIKKKPIKKEKNLPWYLRKPKKKRKKKKKNGATFWLRKIYKKYRYKMPVIPKFLGFVP